jgi:protein-disulfide isomerase
VLRLTTVAIVALFSLSPQQSPADEIAALRKEIAQLKAQQAAMQRDLDVIKNLLRVLADGSPSRVEPYLNESIDIAGEPTRGAPTAKVTMVEVSDYHCPFCRKHMQETQPRIDAEYINTGKVRYVFVDFPIQQLHPNADKAHQAAICAGEQGKYWEMHAQLFAAPSRDVGQLESQAKSIGVNDAEFRKCLEGGKYASQVRDSVARMSQLGLDSTPTFLLGLTPASGQPFKILKVVRGAVPFPEFKQALDSVQ